MYGESEKDNYEMRFLSGTRNERKVGQNISIGNFWKVINKAVLLDTFTGVGIFFPV